MYKYTQLLDKEVWEGRVGVGNSGIVANENMLHKSQIYIIVVSISHWLTYLIHNAVFWAPILRCLISLCKMQETYMFNWEMYVLLISYKQKSMMRLNPLPIFEQVSA